MPHNVDGKSNKKELTLRQGAQSGFMMFFRVSEGWFSGWYWCDFQGFFRVLYWFSGFFKVTFDRRRQKICDFCLSQTRNLPSLLLSTSCPPQAIFFWKVSLWRPIFRVFQSPQVIFRCFIKNGPFQGPFFNIVIFNVFQVSGSAGLPALRLKKLLPI